MDVTAWLRGLGLERYEATFRDNEIDWEVLPKLTSEDLREIGVAAIGHRRKLLDAIAALGASARTTCQPGGSAGAASAGGRSIRRKVTVTVTRATGSIRIAPRAARARSVADGGTVRKVAAVVEFGR